jgi:hypothetical protein
LFNAVPSQQSVEVGPSIESAIGDNGALRL